MKDKLAISPSNLNLVRGFIGIAIGAFFLWLSIRKISIEQIINVLSEAHLSWLIMGMFLYSFDIFVRVIRWRELLIHLKKISLNSLSKALLVGYAMNNILPARLGELFRADFAGKLYNLSRTSMAASIILERTLDGLIVVFCLIVGRIFISNNSVINNITIIGSVLFIIIFMILWSLNKGYGTKWFNKINIPDFLIKKIERFREGLNIIGQDSLIKILVISILIWILETFAVWSVIKSVGISLNIQQMLSFIGVISLSTLMPSAPGFVGTYQYAYGFMANLFGYEMVQGVAAATLAQIFLLGTLTIIGLLIYFYLTIIKKEVKNGR